MNLTNTKFSILKKTDISKMVRTLDDNLDNLDDKRSVDRLIILTRRDFQQVLSQLFFEDLVH